MSSVALDQYLSALSPFLLEEGVTEVMINRPGEVIVEGSGGKRVETLELPFEKIMQMAGLIATFNQQRLTKETPILSATLPGGERVQVIIPPAVKPGQIGVAIRKPCTLQISLDEYASSGVYDSVKVEPRDGASIDEQLLAFKQQGDIDSFMRLAVSAHKNIIIAGGTSSGKTTYANALIAEIDSDERIITIEDVPEIRVPQLDHLNMLASKGGQGVAKVTIQTLLEASLRLNPDRIFIGELRGEEAFYFLRAANSGHPGAISTLHANSATEAFDQLTLMVQQAGLNLTEDNIREFLHRVIDIVVHFEHNKKAGKRVMTELVFNPRGSAA